VLFTLLGCIWGCSFLLMKIGTRSFTPVEVSFGRICLGAFTVTGLVFAGGQRLPRGWVAWRRLAVAGLSLNVVPYTLFAYATTKVPSVTAGFWHGASPLFTALSVGVTSARSELRPRRVAGLAIGFSGVLTILTPGWHGTGDESVGTAACAVAAVVYGIGYAYVRARLTIRADSALALTAGQLICGTLEAALLLPATVRRAPDPAVGPVACVLVLGIVGTGLASAMNLELIRRVGAATGATVIYLVTVCAAVVGVTFGAESTTWHQPAGSAIIIIGLVLSGRSATSATGIGPAEGGNCRPSTGAPARTGPPGTW
jgi:drug/metabolite transporter (DMT)-like permease